MHIAPGTTQRGGKRSPLHWGYPGVSETDDCEHAGVSRVPKSEMHRGTPARWQALATALGYPGVYESDEFEHAGVSRVPKWAQHAARVQLEYSLGLVWVQLGYSLGTAWVLHGH